VLPLLRAHDLPRPPWSPFARMARHDVIGFVDACIVRSGDPALHVVATAHAELGVFHLADSILMLGPTAGFGIRAAMDSFSVFNSGCAWTVDERDDPVSATFHAMYEPTPHHVDVECAFMAFATRLRAGTGGAFGPLRLEIALPDRGAGEALAREARCEVIYGADQSRFCASRAAWNRRPRFAQPLVAGLVRTGAELLSALPSDLPSSLRRAIADGLRHGQVGIAEVAREIGLSVRSLQRRLREEGTSFAAVLDDERRKLGLALMAHETSAASVAEQLVFSEPSAFTRAFRRWTGMSPRAWRLGAGRRRT